jgi:hypothetical protein
MKKTISYLSAILAVVAVIHFSGCKQFDSNNEALVSDSGNIQQIAPGGITVQNLSQTIDIEITFANSTHTNSGHLSLIIPQNNLKVGVPVTVVFPLSTTIPGGVTYGNFEPQSNPTSLVNFDTGKGTVVISKYDTQNKRLEGLLQKCAFSSAQGYKDTVDCAFFVNY